MDVGTRKNQNRRRERYGRWDISPERVVREVEESVGWDIELPLILESSEERERASTLFDPCQRGKNCQDASGSSIPFRSGRVPDVVSLFRSPRFHLDSALRAKSLASGEDISFR